MEINKVYFHFCSGPLAKKHRIIVLKGRVKSMDINITFAV